jgi:transposase
VWRRFDRWSKKGIWERIMTELGDPDFEKLILDSTVIRAHQHAAGKKGGQTVLLSTLATGSCCTARWRDTGALPGAWPIIRAARG